MRTIAAAPPRRQPDSIVTRAAFAYFASRAAPDQSHPVSPASVLKSRWPDDAGALRLVERAAVSPASTTSAPWAGVLASSVTGEYFSTLPNSAGARLIAAGAIVPLTGHSEIDFPKRVTPASGDAPWIAEGAPIPVGQIPLAAATFGPARKFALILAASSELAEQAGGAGVFRTLLLEQSAMTLDAALFSTAAASALRPAGLLSGITPLTATAGGGRAAMETDISALTGAVAAAGGSVETMVIVAAPRQAAAIAVLAPDLRILAWSTTALAPGAVVVVDTAAFASAFGAAPEITASRDATVHMEDAAVLALATAPQGSGVLATAIRSAFQTDTILTKLVCRVAFVMRAPLIAHLTGVTW